VQKTTRKGSASPCPSVVTSARSGRPVFFRFDSSESTIQIHPRAAVRHL